MKDKIFFAFMKLIITFGICVVLFCVGYAAADSLGFTPKAESVYIPRSELKEIF